MFKIIVIEALFRNGVYSVEGRLPQDNKKEMKHFKETTMGHVVIMGRKTWESLPAQSRPLEGRMNAVVSSNVNYRAEGAYTVSTLEQGIEAVVEHGLVLYSRSGHVTPTTYDRRKVKIFVIGGRSLWESAMDYADTAVLSIFNKEYPITEGTLTAPRLLAIPTWWPDFHLRQGVHGRLDGSNSDFITSTWERK